MKKELTREQIDVLGLLAAGYALRKRQDHWILRGKGYVIAPPGGDSGVNELMELQYVEGSSLSDKGRKAWEEWCAANPQLVPRFD